VAQSVLHKRSSTPAAVPTTGDLAAGELAINSSDGKIFLKKSGGGDGIVTIARTTDLITSLTGDVTASGTGAVASTIANDAVTYAKMQNISTQNRIIGRKTSGAGDPEECTLSQVLDMIGSPASGDILYRGASDWARLAKGSDGNILTLASGLPSWAAPAAASGTLSKIASIQTSGTGTLSATSLTACKAFLIIFYNVLSGTADANLVMAVSCNNGSSYGTSATIAQCPTTSATRRYEGLALVTNANLAATPKLIVGMGVNSGSSATGLAGGGGGRETNATHDDTINAIRFQLSIGNFSGNNGYIEIWGWVA
jgi:hypothetical protein